MITEEELRQYGCSVENLFTENSIELDWHREDQNWRSFRLHRVAGYIRAVADCTGNRQLLKKVARLFDSKGDLTVYWHELPNEYERTVIAKAWESECEAPDMIQHELEEKCT